MAEFYQDQTVENQFRPSPNSQGGVCNHNQAKPRVCTIWRITRPTSCRSFKRLRAYKTSCNGGLDSTSTMTSGHDLH